MVGVLIEVPVMLGVVKLVNRSKDWYEAGQVAKQTWTKQVNHREHRAKTSACFFA